MQEIWANLLLPKALKSCPKSNKLPNLITLLKGEREGPEPKKECGFGTHMLMHKQNSFIFSTNFPSETML